MTKKIRKSSRLKGFNQRIFGNVSLEKCLKSVIKIVADYFSMYQLID